MAKPTGAEVTTPPAIVEPLTTAQAEPEVQAPESTPPESVKDAEFWKGKATAMEKEATKAAKRLAQLEDAEQKRADAEKTELQKATERADAAERKAAESERKAIRQKVAAEIGLPAILAERLQGDDEDAMRADAAKLLEALPKADPAKKQNPTINPTNPAAAQQGETLAQKKERLHLNPDVSLFGEGDALKGGGVFLVGE
jgi:hypothetical protein